MTDEHSDQRMKLYQLLQKIHDATAESGWVCESKAEYPVDAIDDVVSCNSRIMWELAQIQELLQLPKFKVWSHDVLSETIDESSDS